jgi:hypothetical protein
MAVTARSPMVSANYARLANLIKIINVRIQSRRAVLCCVRLIQINTLYYLR